MTTFSPKFVMLGAAVALGFTAQAAQAASVLHLDINTITAQAKTSGGVDGFGGLTHTGSIIISQGAGSLVGIDLDGVDQVFSGDLSNLTGTINLVNGAVTGGSLAVEVTDGSDIDTYQLNLAPDGDSKVQAFGSTSFLISSLTSGGAFDDINFGGVDISDFTGNNLSGVFVQFSFNPGITGRDTRVDVDLDVRAGTAIPLPASAWAGLALMGLVAGTRLVRRGIQKA